MQTVQDLMTTPAMTLDRNDELSVADELMNAARIRHLPVLNDRGRLVGIVTQRDLFHSALVRALGYGTAANRRNLDAAALAYVELTLQCVECHKYVRGVELAGQLDGPRRDPLAD